MEKLKKLSVLDKTPAIVFSVFSVIFSLSILKELYTQVEFYFLIILGTFITSFLIYNEIIKVRELKKCFLNKKYSKIFLYSTLLISITLSSIGIYLWTNKTHKISNEILINKTKEIASIEKEYNSIKYEMFEETENYKNLIKNIDYWENKSAATLDERTTIRERIDYFQKTLVNERNSFNNTIEIKRILTNNEKENAMNSVENKYKVLANNSERNNYISLIFLTMVLITEGLIILLNKDLSHKELTFNEYNSKGWVKKYLLFRTIFSTLYLRKKEGAMIGIRDFTISNLNKIDKDIHRIDFFTMKMFYNSLHAANVITITDSLTGDAKLLHSKKKGIKLLDNYFKNHELINELFS